MKVSIIGYGEMAKAIAKGLKGNVEFEVIGRNEEKLKKFANDFECDYYLLDGFDITNKIILLAIKPYTLQEVSMRIKGEAKVLISILAGKSVFEIEKYIKSNYYLRAMPNIAAKYQASTTALTGDVEVKELGEKILGYIGDVIWVNNDDEIDMATAIIGSGPAFLSLIASAIEDAGVYTGLKREISHKLTKGLFKSFTSLKENFDTIKNQVMSPKGTTAEGVYSLEEDGIRGKIMKGVIKTYEKSKKI
ncbi:pyrroline-5-carboxylate reductase [Caminibacter mediatlanticus]|uniref:Pyrroline-5-carboxylate reductase n=1 Tax=Caminibacter mediatlanticus TB-2 TaxID=391592 RepID=A0AAI9AIR0_9BACT|nr:pyrroline-5-carboxylate reductase [Caminibacter mediatlanticus]EDM24247.1 Delta 1-pyrroline-5-carboxylate reductase [Caminibacter mediatlanticus TB-2]